MPSLLDVTNQVLIELGYQPVQVVNANAQALLISSKINVLHPELLLRTDWNWAIKYVLNNTPNSSVISPDFLYNYTLPPDYNRMDRFSWYYNSAAFGFYYRIIDNVIMTNFRPVSYYYVVNNADLSVIDPLYYRALVLYVAYVTCKPLTQNLKLAEDLKHEYKEKLADAIQKNDMDRAVLSTPMNDFDRQAYI